jgi:hypothetical protein
VNDPLARLAGELRAGGGLLAQAVVDPLAGEPTPHGDAVASRGPDYPLLVEAIREGYLLHYGAGRVVRTDDPDLALLAGDRLYALGLARLADLGDLEGVGILADVISRSAQAHAQDDPAEADRAWSDGTSRLAG